MYKRQADACYGPNPTEPGEMQSRHVAFWSARAQSRQERHVIRGYSRKDRHEITKNCWSRRSLCGRSCGANAFARRGSNLRATRCVLVRLVGTAHLRGCASTPPPALALPPQLRVQRPSISAFFPVGFDDTPSFFLANLAYFQPKSRGPSLFRRCG